MSTTIPVSTAPAVRTYLFNAVTTAVAARAYADPGVQVSLGELSDPEDYSDIIVIGKTVIRTPNVHRMVGSGGPHWLREDYTVSIHITCADMHSPDFVAVDARGYELLALVETVVRADPGLGGLVIVAKPGPSHAESEYDSNHSGAICLIESAINIHAEQ